MFGKKKGYSPTFIIAFSGLGQLGIVTAVYIKRFYCKQERGKAFPE
jgi:hypothetical protein